MRLRNLASLLAGFAAVSCGGDGEPPIVAEEILSLNAEANQVVIGLEHFVTSEGVRRALVKADTAFFIEQRGVVELRRVEVTFYDADGVETSVLTAREGTYDWNTGNMDARQDVVVVNPLEGRRIETAVMHYDRVADRIWSESRTTMYEPNGTVVEGLSFVSNSSMDRVELEEPRVIRRSSQPPP
jgi:LPS export ABC transporter protein LptC